MKFRVDITKPSHPDWIKAVLNDFDAFLQDHADCERKASAMAMSFVAKYPDRKEIIPELIDTAIEELEHFQRVYEIMEEREVALPAKMQEDNYIKGLLKSCRNGKNERFLDRLLIASIVECRGAERFKIVYENVKEERLKKFYQMLWASEAKHGEVFVQMALNYFDQRQVYNRLEDWATMEADIISQLPLRAALH